MTYDAFLSGPIANTADYRQRFALAQMEVKRRKPGAKVWNPALLPADMSYRWLMTECIKALFESRLIVMLPDWRDSPGARAEYAIAESIGVPYLEL